MGNGRCRKPDEVLPLNERTLAPPVSCKSFICFTRFELSEGRDDLLGRG